MSTKLTIKNQARKVLGDLLKNNALCLYEVDGNPRLYKKVAVSGNFVYIDLEFGGWQRLCTVEVTPVTIEKIEVKYA